MRNKRISIQEAAEIVRDGSRLTFAGFTIWRKPFALAYELIRQQRRNLHLIEIGGGSISDCLIGAGCVDFYESCWVGHELYGKYGANLSRKVKNKEVIMEDYSHGEMVFRFAAAAADNQDLHRDPVLNASEKASLARPSTSPALAAAAFALSP